MTRQSKHIDHAGFSIPAFAKETGIPEATVRLAIKKKQIETIEFAGMKRIPRHELDRIRAELGLKGEEKSTFKPRQFPEP